MPFSKKDLRLYAITDRNALQGADFNQAVEEALAGGVTFLQLREKTLDDAAFLAATQEVKALCQRYQVPFVINDAVDIALAVDADGVHVGQDDMAAETARQLLGPDKILGVSAKTVAQAQAAEKAGADYLGVGAVFPTGSKKDAVPIDWETFQAIRQAVNIPIVAIGGITQDNLSELKALDIDGVAVISAIFAQENIADAAQALSKQLEEMIHA